MDKRTLSQYGWSVITIIVLTIMLGLATPFGNYIATSLRAVTFSLSDVQKEEINKYNTEGYVIPTDYLASEIEQIPTIYGIGRDDQTFVVANFNDDYTECLITKNGLNSNGAMMDFDNASELFVSPLFEHRSTLKKVTIDYGVTNVGGNLFEDCANLTDVILHSSVSDFGIEHAGLPSWNLTTKSLTVYFNPEVDYTYIKNDIKKAIVLDGTKTIKTDWFKGWNTIVEIQLPESLNTIEDEAFDGCTKLSTIRIPNSVVSLGKNAFHDCSDITSIQIPTGLEIIPEGCFWAATKLSHISIPNNIKRIESSAFDTCTSLKEVILPDSIDEIGSNAFAQCSSLEKIELPTNLKIMGDDVFMGDKELSSIKLPNTLSDTGYGILEDCETLKNVSIGNGIRHIKSRTFDNDVAIENIIIPNSVQQMTDCFKNCTSLGNIYIPKSVTIISESAFEQSPDSLIIQCEQGSYAESWAMSHGYRTMYDTHYMILKVISNAYNASYGYSKITPATIATSTQYTASTVNTCINTLISFGYIDAVSSNDGYNVTDKGKDIINAFAPLYGYNPI